MDTDKGETQATAACPPALDVFEQTHKSQHLFVCTQLIIQTNYMRNKKRNWTKLNFIIIIIIYIAFFCLLTSRAKRKDRTVKEIDMRLVNSRPGLPSASLRHIHSIKRGPHGERQPINWRGKSQGCSWDQESRASRTPGALKDRESGDSEATIAWTSVRLGFLEDFSTTMAV